MKRIELTVGLRKLGEVHGVLRTIGVNDIASNEGDVRRKMQNEVAGGADVQVGPSETRLEIIVTAERAAEVIRAFASPGWRDLLDDSKIVVYEIAGPIPARESDSRENPR